jgi:hypothetical protein
LFKGQQPQFMPGGQEKAEHNDRNSYYAAQQVVDRISHGLALAGKEDLQVATRCLSDLASSFLALLNSSWYSSTICWMSSGVSIAGS